MNCKQGDLAMVVGTRVEGLNGTVVTCCKFIGGGLLNLYDDLWLIDKELPTLQGASIPYMADRHLISISPKEKVQEEAEDTVLVEV